jgi:hypothetical protein
MSVRNYHSTTRQSVRYSYGVMQCICLLADGLLVAMGELCFMGLVMWATTSGLQSGNACYHSVQNLLSSSLLSKNIKIKIHRTIILSVVLYGCETWSFTLREERRLRAFENRVLRRIFGPNRDEVRGEWTKTT